GRHVRVEAPPGTGRTQTVANMAAELVARGQRVLVVAHKRATLTDLVTRLDGAGLGDAVLDLTTAEAEAAAVQTIIDTAHRLGSAPVSTATASGPPAAVAGDDPLGPYLSALHRRRDPWGCSAYDVMAAVAAAAPESRVDARISREHADRLGVGTREALRAKLRAYAELGGLSRSEKTTPWSGATVASSEEAARLDRAVTELHTTGLPELRNAATRAAVEVGLAGPRTPAQAFEIVDLLTA